MNPLRLSLVAVIVLAAAPAAACPFRPRVQVDPVVALEESLRDGGELAEVMKTARWMARKKSNAPDRRAHALAVLAVAHARSGDPKAAARSLDRALSIHRDTAYEVVARIDAAESPLLAAAKERLERIAS